MITLVQIVSYIFSGAFIASIYEVFLNIAMMLSPLFEIAIYLFTLISYLINVLLSSIGFIFIVIQEFFLGFWGYFKQLYKFFLVIYDVWNRLLDIFYTALGYITGIIAFIFNFAETGGEDIFSS